MRLHRLPLLGLAIIGTFTIAFGAPAGSLAQQWSGLLSPSRAMDWSRAGAAVVNRTTSCANLFPGASAADINAAIASCPDGQVVRLSAGTYTLSGGIDFANKSNVTLRGAGANQTVLVFSGNVSCFGLMTAVCIRNGEGHYSGGPSNTAIWTGGFSQGGTSITLSNTNNLTAGSLLALDQLNDTSDTGDIFICSTVGICSNGGPGGAGRLGRELHQLVLVTGINGNTVTITPGIAMPNFRGSQSPGAWWSHTVVSGIGIEDLQIDQSSAGNNGMILFNAFNCWVKNVHSRWAGTRSHIWIYGSKNISIQDSYFFEGKSHASQSYGIETFTAADVLIQNNIFQKITAPIIFNGTGHGSVVSYNYLREMTYTVSPTWMIPSNDHHATGIGYVLHEGNLGSGMIFDNVHGPGAMITAFRNYWPGTETGKAAQTIPVQLYHYNRYFNLLGNVLGTPGYHLTYECSPSSSTQTSCGSGGNTSIYTLGWSGNGGQFNGSWGLNDVKVSTTMLRWGNYDHVTGNFRWDTREIPSTINLYGNPIPSTQSLPASLYLASKPLWWGTAPWPSIGPGVESGDIQSAGGHVWRNPARLCYDKSAKNADSGEISFNAALCYGRIDDVVAPTPPTNIRIN